MDKCLVGGVDETAWAVAHVKYLLETRLNAFGRLLIL